MAGPAPRARVIAIRVGGSLILLCAIWFWPVAPHVSPSFNCAGATLPTELTICADPQLAGIDIDAAAYFQDNVQAAKGFGDSAASARLRASKAAFLTARDRCGSEKWCIEREYAKWDHAVQTIGGAAHPLNDPGSPRRRPTRYLGAYLLGLHG